MQFFRDKTDDLWHVEVSYPGEEWRATTRPGTGPLGYARSVAVLTRKQYGKDGVLIRLVHADGRVEPWDAAWAETY